MAIQPVISVLWPPSRLSSSMRAWKPVSVTLRWRVLHQSPPVWLWTWVIMIGSVIGELNAMSIQSRPVW